VKSSESLPSNASNLVQTPTIIQSKFALRKPTGYFVAMVSLLGLSLAPGGGKKRDVVFINSKRIALLSQIS